MGIRFRSAGSSFPVFLFLTLNSPSKMTILLLCFSGLILVKMLSEYIEMNNSLPGLSSEVVHRVVEILKLFNTRTCQLVLGAGAMQVCFGFLNIFSLANCCCFSMCTFFFWKKLVAKGIQTTTYVLDFNPTFIS